MEQNMANVRNRPSVTESMKSVLPKWCCNCGSTKNLVYHHIVPVSVGGNHILSNIVVLCENCHSRIHFGNDGHISHSKLIKEALANMKSNGEKLGRPKLTIDAIPPIFFHNYPSFKNGTLNVSEFARTCEMSRTTIYRYIHMVEEQQGDMNG